MITKKILFFTLLLPSIAFSAVIDSPVKGVAVNSTNNSYLSIHNLSPKVVKVSVLGELFTLNPVSALNFNCSGDEYVELTLNDGLHAFFEVPCKSKVIINESFQF